MAYPYYFYRWWTGTFMELPGECNYTDIEQPKKNIEWSLVYTILNDSANNIEDAMMLAG